MPLRYLAIAALALTALMPADLASAQTVRRHLHCQLGGAIEIPGLLVGPFSLGKPVIATNNWSFTIPKGTKFTSRIGNSSRTTTFTSTAALAPGASMVVASSPTGTTCDVTIPG